jgi:hypothetical protein
MFNQSLNSHFFGVSFFLNNNKEKEKKRERKIGRWNMLIAEEKKKG